jgi:hypothetical protein
MQQHDDTSPPANFLEFVRKPNETKLDQILNILEQMKTDNREVLIIVARLEQMVTAGNVGQQEIIEYLHKIQAKIGS